MVKVNPHASSGIRGTQKGRANERQARKSQTVEARTEREPGRATNETTDELTRMLEQENFPRNHLFGALERPNRRSEVCPDANLARSFRCRGGGRAIAVRHMRSSATAGERDRR